MLSFFLPPLNIQLLKWQTVIFCIWGRHKGIRSEGHEDVRLRNRTNPCTQGCLWTDEMENSPPSPTPISSKTDGVTRRASRIEESFHPASTTIAPNWPPSVSQETRNEWSGGCSLLCPSERASKWVKGESLGK